MHCRLRYFMYMSEHAYKTTSHGQVFGMLETLDGMDAKGKLAENDRNEY